MNEFYRLLCRWFQSRVGAGNHVYRLVCTSRLLVEAYLSVKTGEIKALRGGEARTCRRCLPKLGDNLGRACFNLSKYPLKDWRSIGLGFLVASNTIFLDSRAGIGMTCGNTVRRVR